MTWADIRIRFDVKSWRIIKGFENYRVTSCGRVWSCAQEKFIRMDYNISSYLRVELWKDGARHWLFVHRLVCYAYKRNKRPNVKTQVNHMDHDQHNNKAGNLEHVTPSTNILHAKYKIYRQYIYKGRGKWKKISFKEMLARTGDSF